MKKEKKEKVKRLRPRWFGGLKAILKLIIKKPNFVYLGEEVKPRSLILSNHVGAKGPLSLELYFKTPFRFWGTYEMNSNIFKVYAYLSKIYFHEKKHWPLILSRIFCVIAAPLLWIFYRGLNLISTYKDHRFRTTVKQSVKEIELGRSIVIFPEDSSKGYFDKLSMFFAGFMVFARKCYQKGFDLPIFVAYLRKKDKQFIFDKPVLYSELVSLNLSDQEIADKLCARMNELAEVNID